LLLAKENEDKRRKGVVGSKGTKIPRIPSIRDINPRNRKKNLTIGFGSKLSIPISRIN